MASLESSLHKSSLFRSTLSISLNCQNQTTIDNEGNTELQSDHSSAKGKDINVDNNQVSDTISFRDGDAELIESILRENLMLTKSIKTGGNDTSIFKKPDGSVTVTIYRTTNRLHVQGRSYVEWTRNFKKIFAEKKSTVSDIVNCSFDVANTLPQLSSTPKPHSINTDGDKSTVQDLCQMVMELSSEIVRLREKLTFLEYGRVPIEVTNSSTQTSIKHVNLGTQTPMQETKSRHAQCEIVSQETIPKTASLETTPKSNVSVTAPTQIPTVKNKVESKKTSTKKSNPAARFLYNSVVQEKKDTRKETLILGSSITQRIRKRGLRKDVNVKTIRGAELSTIRSEVSSLNLSGMRNVIIQAGGNDVSRGRDMEAIENDLAEIIMDIQHRSPRTSVYICEVLPRKNVDVACVNQTVESVCEMYGANIIKTSKAIPKLNARQFWRDGIHLTDSGTRDLLHAYEQYVPILKNGIKFTGCVYCGEENHNYRECRHGDKLVCHSCNRSGHKAKLCSY